MGSFAGMFPGTLMLVILGTFTDFAAEQSAQPRGSLVNLLYAAAVAGALVATWIVTRFARRALERHREEFSGETPE